MPSLSGVSRPCHTYGPLCAIGAVSPWPQPSPKTRVPAQELEMLAKCANPRCSAPFRRLSEGKLFLVQSELIASHEAVDPEKNKPPRRVEYFWLCAECARLLTLTFNGKTGVTTVPLAAVNASRILPETRYAAVQAQRALGVLGHARSQQRG